MKDFPKTFDPKAVEAGRYARWEAAGLFACDPDSPGQPFTMMMPPPNVTGSLHIGHALNMTLQDILARFWRARGRDVLWQPGTDHASIAVHMVLERQGVNRFALGREAFLDKAWAWRAESGGRIVHQLRRLGVGPDWARERFTLDEGLSRAVNRAFVTLYRQGLIYKDTRLVNWDPERRTAVSDLEVHMKEVRGRMWHIAYPVAGEEARHITVATTRPETMLGDAAVAVHPDDPRYQDLIGRFVALPLTDRLIPIIADAYADPEQGTGAVKITPAHDFNDYEVGRRHGLPCVSIFDDRACVNGNAPEAFRGLDRFAARKAVLAELEALDLIEKVEDITHSVPYDEKSKATVLEPYLTEQWYVNAQALAGPALQAVRDGRTRFVPAQWENTYALWLEDIRPWCISRQLWWGHQIPAWYGPDGTAYVAENEQEAQAQAGQGVRLTRDPDVLDTWFSAALWPFSTLGWPEETAEVARYHPGDVLVTGFDIIFFWVARMMMMGLHLTGKVPFRDVYVHALVRDAAGQKMSKTKGNVIDPLDLCDRYGADALRFTLAAMAAQGRDIRLAERRVAGYRNFVTKLWNAARFAQMHGVALCDAPDEDTALSRWIVSELDAARDAVEGALEAYQFNAAADALYHFVWHTFCDWYLEFAKDAPASRTTGFVLGEILKLLNPFMPFIAEELYERLGGRGLLAAQVWPVPRARDDAAVAEVQGVIEAIGAVRTLRKDMNISDRAYIALYIVGKNSQLREPVCDLVESVMRMANLSEVYFVAEADEVPEGNAVRFVVRDATLVLPLGDLIDPAAEGARLAGEVAKLDKEIKGLDAKLASADFTAKAPAEVVADIRARLEAATARRARLAGALAP